MSFIAKSIAAALTLATTRPAAPSAPVETAQDVAEDIAQRQKMRREREKAYHEMIEEQCRRKKSGEWSREEFERATVEWLKKYPAP